MISKRNRYNLSMQKICRFKEKGTMGIDTSHNIVKMLDIVQFVPNLGYNFFNIEQPMSNRNSLWFDDDACGITNNNSGKKVRITMMSNKMFLLNISNMESFILVASANDESMLWYLRYGHFNIKGL